MDKFTLKERYGVAVLAAALLLVYGCGGKSVSDDDAVIAKINKYKLTVKDFTEETKQLPSLEYLSKNPDVAKEEILDELITRKILTQEAQAQGLDRDAAFMKDIEQYWEQALLKSFLKKKTEELSRGIEVKESEVMREYERVMSEEGASIGSYEKLAPELRDEIRRRKIHEAFDKWIVDLRYKSDIKVNKENLNKVRMK